jgi:HK97 family phage major capsid protein
VKIKPSPYLLQLRGQYDAHAEAVRVVQTQAAEHKDAEGKIVGRDLTADEVRSVEVATVAMTELAPKVQATHDTELRNATIAGLAADIDDAPVEGAPVGQARTAGQVVGTASTALRDPGHYRSEAAGGQLSFFADQYRSQVHRDDAATARLAETENHLRAGLASGTEGVGMVAPKWLTDRFELILRQGRDLANAVQNIPLGSDPRPMTVPKQTVGTTTVVAQQAAENDAVAVTDQFDSDVDTITPMVTAGSQVFSRQFLDMATPAIDLLLMNDLVANYNLQIEKRVGAAMITAAGTAVATFANEAAFLGAAPAVPAIDAIIDTSLAIRAGLYAPADILAMGTARLGKFKKLKDTAGRPLLPLEGGTMNVYGSANAVNIEGRIEGLGVIATEGVNVGTYPESILVARGADTWLFEGNMMRFRYEEVSGPQSIRVGIWNYVALSCRRPGVAQRRIVVTAAT